MSVSTTDEQRDLRSARRNFNGIAGIVSDGQPIKPIVLSAEEDRTDRLLQDARRDLCAARTHLQQNLPSVRQIAAELRIHITLVSGVIRLVPRGAAVAEPEEAPRRAPVIQRLRRPRPRLSSLDASRI